MPEDRTDKAKILQHYCEAVGTCLKVKILNVVKVAGNEYKFKVQFIQDDGNVYEYSPCCGRAEEKTPQQTEFDHYVHKIDGVFKVRTPPLFRP
ncbi:MAG: hypothetical protein L6290_11320 [Thermodesulfovibrionales bacterium]|nr:hypothetical protein [Thermodesulfovibrionales bacterium]